jgi:hypothetical protein
VLGGRAGGRMLALADVLGRVWRCCCYISIIVQASSVEYSAQVVVNPENNNAHLMRDGGHPGCLVPSLPVAAATNPNIDFLYTTRYTHHSY